MASHSRMAVVEWAEMSIGVGMEKEYTESDQTRQFAALSSGLIDLSHPGNYSGKFDISNQFD
jgi:hypothetical protein